MSKSKDSSYCATLIGDVVGSRRAPDRGHLHRQLSDVLAELNAELSPFGPLTVTVGDEFQGHFDQVGQAVHAAFLIRVRLLPDVDTRFGLGWGEIQLLDAERGIQDGPGWWRAREAIEWVATTQQHAALHQVRTGFLSDVSGSPTPPALRAALLCRDQLLGSLDDRSLRILRGLMQQQSQAQLAEAEGISRSAVSQRVKSAGIGAILAAESELAAVR
jgi:hypothetical protein